MAQGNISAVWRHAEHRLGIFPARTSGGGVTGVPHRHMPLQSIQGLLIKDLGDQTEVFKHHDLVSVAYS